MSTVEGEAVSVRPVSGRKDLKAFIDLPFRLYADDPHWVAPLRMDVRKLLNRKKNAFFEHGDMQLFLARDGEGRVVGRIAAILNGMHLKKYSDGVGFFGFFESEDRQDIADGLIAAAEAWLGAKGLVEMRGPVNPSLNDTAGILVDGFDSPPFVLMTHNPRFYNRLLADAGFTLAIKLWAYYAHRKFANMEKLQRGVALVRRRYPGLTLRTIDMKRFKEEANTIREIYNEAWSENWGHVPMTEREFQQLAADMKQVVDPNMAYFLEMDGKPIAFSVAIPNMNRALAHVKDGRLFPFGIFKLLPRVLFGDMHEARLPLLGVSKAYHGRGFDAVLVLETALRLPPMGYVASEMSWVLDSNTPLMNALESMGGVRHKEYAILQRPITSSAVSN